MHFYYKIVDNMVASTKCFLLFYLICFVSIVFFGEFVENGEAFAQEEETQKCIEFIDPKTAEELKVLRICLKKLNFESGFGKSAQVIKRSYEGSLKLIEKLNMNTDNKSSTQLQE